MLESSGPAEWVAHNRVIRGIREDELATQSLGKNTFRYKASIFTVSSAMAGIAGALLGRYLGFVGPDLFIPFITFIAFRPHGILRETPVRKYKE